MSCWNWILLFPALVFAWGCDPKPENRTPGGVTSEDVRRDAAKALETATEYSQQAKEQLQKDLEIRLNQLEAEVARLREKGRELQDDAKANWDQKMAALEIKREAARVKLAEVGQSTAEAWKDVQKGAQSAWDELDKAVREAAKEF